MKKKLFTVFLLFTVILSLFSENIRGEVKNVILIETENLSTDFNLFDLTGINIGKNPFIEGLELTLSIPDELERYRDSFMLNIYYKLNSLPDKSLKSYRGSLLLSQIIPASKKMFISIPMTSVVNTDLIPGSIVSKQINQTDFPIIISINPVMKGIPNSVLSSIFDLKIIPVLSSKGILELNITGANNEHTIILDGKKLVKTKEYNLEEGIHQLVIQSYNFEEVSQSFVITRGKRTRLNFVLKQLFPTVMFEAPEGSEIILDGEKITSSLSKAMEVTPGEHVVRMKLGDYSLSKKFTINAQKKYIISLFLDILIQEN